VTDAKLVYWTR